jgi:hypothetical protein
MTKKLSTKKLVEFDEATGAITLLNFNRPNDGASVSAWTTKGEAVEIVGRGKGVVHYWGND